MTIQKKFDTVLTNGNHNGFHKQEKKKERFKVMKIDWTGIAIGLGMLVVAVFAGFLIWYGLWVNNIEKHQFGYAFDRVTGDVESFTNNGWVVRTPIRYSVHVIDLRPAQLTLNANQRVLNAKLVRFNPKGIDTFIQWHGCGTGSGDNSYTMQEILKSYAFDPENGKDCPFLDVISEIAPSQTGTEK